MDFRNLAMILVLVFGILIGDGYHKIITEIQTGDCGVKPGHTTLVTEDDGEIICIYRQNGWPFKTTSGRNV